MKGKYTAIWLGFGNIVLGATIYYAIGTLSRSPAWTLVNSVVPQIVMPALFVVAGILLLIGGVSDQGSIARVGWVIAGFLMVTWAAITLITSFVLGTPIEAALTGAIFLVNIGVLKFSIALQTLGYEKISFTVNEIVSEAQEEGLTVGE